MTSLFKKLAIGLTSFVVLLSVYLGANALDAFGGTTLQTEYKTTEVLFPTFVEVNGEKINFPYTDENVVIKTNKKNYGGWSYFDVYASVENHSGAEDQGYLYGYFKGSEIGQISKLVKNVAYQVDVNEYKDFEFIDKETGKTEIENRIVGSHKETRYRDEWQLVNLSLPRTKYDLKNLVKENYIPSKSASDILPKDGVNYYKIRVNITPKTQGEFILEWKGNTTYSALDPWYNASYQYCQKVTLVAGSIATTTTNGYPIVSTTTQAILKTVTNGGHVGMDDGSDIVFTSGTDCNTDSGSLLNYERELYASTTGQLVYHIKSMDISSTTNKTVLMYYGNASATDQATTTGVWDSTYAGVWHFPNNTTSSTSDSTLNANNGQTVNGASTTPNGYIEGAMTFNGLNTYVNNGSGSSLDDLVTPSYEVIIYPYSWGENNLGYIIQKGTYLNFGKFICIHNVPGGVNQPTVEFSVQWSGANGTFYAPANPFALNTWNHIAVTYNGNSTSNYPKIYINGVSVAVTRNTAPSGTLSSEATRNLTIGNRSDTTDRSFYGIIDETRIRNINIHAMDIKTDYNCMMLGCTTYGAEETQTVVGGVADTDVLIMEN